MGIWASTQVHHHFRGTNLITNTKFKFINLREYSFFKDLNHATAPNGRDMRNPYSMKMLFLGRVPKSNDVMDK